MHVIINFLFVLSFEYRLKFSISQKMNLILSELWNLNVIDLLIDVYIERIWLIVTLEDDAF